MNSLLDGEGDRWIKECPKCSSKEVVMFDSNNDTCLKCGKWFPAVARQYCSCRCPGQMRSLSCPVHRGA